MLLSKQVSSILETSLGTTDLLSYAVITAEGVVLDSRESQSCQTKEFPFHPDDGGYSVSPKLQTKVYSTFASEFWRQSCSVRPNAPRWIGAEVHERRFVIVPLARSGLLLLAVGTNVQAWGHIAHLAQKTGAVMASEVIV